LGGNLEVIENRSNHNNYYFEENISNRYSLQMGYNYRGEDDYFTFKNSLGFFERELSLPNYLFSGEQISSFSEAVYKLSAATGDWLIGLNLTTERFNDQSKINYKKSYTDLTAGLFIQNSYDFLNIYSLEMGLRLDYNKDYGLFPLPRINLLVKITPELSSRIGGGFGYKIPSIFTEKSDELAFRNILPIDKDITKAEKSYGFNLDINYSTILFDELVFSFNNLFFYTRIIDPLFLDYNQANKFFEFMTFNGFNDTKGIETNVKLSIDRYKLFAGYTFTDVNTHSNGASSSFPLTPKHRLGIVLIYEIHENLRIGLEAYYTGKQTLSSGINVTDYWINGLMIEKKFNKFSLFLNFENIFDTRQSKYGALFTGSPEAPSFAEIYAPTDGRIINGGIKFNF
jgi:iron complex outermembrane receptor protein